MLLQEAGSLTAGTAVETEVSTQETVPCIKEKWQRCTNMRCIFSVSVFLFLHVIDYVVSGQKFLVSTNSIYPETFKSVCT